MRIVAVAEAPFAFLCGLIWQLIIVSFSGHFSSDRERPNECQGLRKQSQHDNRHRTHGEAQLRRTAPILASFRNLPPIHLKLLRASRGAWPRSSRCNRHFHCDSHALVLVEGANRNRVSLRWIVLISGFEPAQLRGQPCEKFSVLPATRIGRRTGRIPRTTAGRRRRRSAAPVPREGLEDGAKAAPRYAAGIGIARMWLLEIALETIGDPHEVPARGHCRRPARASQAIVGKECNEGSLRGNEEPDICARSRREDTRCDLCGTSMPASCKRLRIPPQS